RRERATQPFDRRAPQQQPDAPADEEQRPQVRPLRNERRADEVRPDGERDPADEDEEQAPAQEPSIDVHGAPPPPRDARAWHHDSGGDARRGTPNGIYSA